MLTGKNWTVGQEGGREKKGVVACEDGLAGVDLPQEREEGIK